MAVKRENLVGNTYGHLTVIQMLNTKRSKCLCACACQHPKCPKQLIKMAQELKSGCGACKYFNDQKRIQSITKHGDSSNYKTHYIRRLWNNIKVRCYNENSQLYKYYGGRGIKMFKPWIDNYIVFKNWILTNLGERPTNKHSIDRINVNGNYTPRNLRWATKEKQAQNMRTSTNKNIVKCLFIDYHKNKNTITDLCKKYKLPRQTIYYIVTQRNWKTFTDTLDI